VQALEAVRKSVLVAAPPETAWEVFVDRIGEWWPLHRHSLADEPETATVDGERIYERAKDGTEHTWGHIVVWEPPHRLAFTWEVRRGGQSAVEIRFTQEGDGTRVEVEHTGFEAYGANAPAIRASYEPGWEFVLGCYVKAAW
jgi:uncharacterized protein YndB with AHSA1/START domain